MSADAEISKSVSGLDDSARALDDRSATGPALTEAPPPSGQPRIQAKYGSAFSILALAVIYFGFARLGLSVATVAKSVTLLWPGTGISLAALLLFGYRLWPGVALGAFAVNALTPGVPVLTACAMAAGNTFEALLGTYLLRRAGFKTSLERVRDVVMLLVLAAGLSTTVSATFGALSLWLGRVIDQAQVGMAWRVWWLGDLMGDLIVAPLLLTAVARARWRKRPHRLNEGIALTASLLGISLLAFGIVQFPMSRLIHPYVVFPVLIWAALRFHLLGAATANFFIASIAAWMTVQGKGPFSTATLNENLFQLQTFMAVVALTSLILAAVAAERLRAIRLRDEFLSMASHELRTPLTPMKLQIHLLRRTVERGAHEQTRSEEFRKRFALLERQVERIVSLVDELLDVSRVSAGRLSLNFDKLELGTLVRDTVEAFKEESAVAKCSVEVRSDQAVEGYWDRLRIQQVVSNLLSNAMKYGSGKPITVSVQFAKYNQSAQVVVADCGMGIPKEQQGLIFEAFERGSHAPRISGLGLGLYIVSKIVEAHHGSVRVDSEVGVGSTFTVELPVRSSPSTLANL